ncbi:MAG TPA: HYR domain-containing protein, partial [Gaiellaceae bacterium]|nr:HYR domain-containing protein [Gaiellaceae bacterium]
PTLSGPSLVTVDATTPSGGVATFDVTATDDVTPTPGVTCDPPSGNVFPMGDTVVTCTASDEAGNTATMTLTVHVRDAAEQLANLQADVHALGLRPVLALTLQAELQGAQAAVAAGKPRPACAALGLFAAEVRLASGRGIPAAEAADLVAAANRIRAVLGC